MILKSVLKSSLMLLTALSISSSAFANSYDQAKRIHDRIAGVPPSEAVLNQMEALISSGNALGAAELALENESFYDVTLKNWAAPLTNIDQDVFVPLNDYTATLVGLVRDDKDFRQLLHEDILYIADPSLGITAYSNSNNNHYEALESSGNSLKTALVERNQSTVTGVPAEATAGVLTTRAAAKAFFYAGTNRANFRFALLNYLCKDLEQVKDITRVPDRIRQDVTRSPGGDSRIFLNNCVGCHSGMDPMAQAFAYYEYSYDTENDPDGENGQMVYNSESMLDPVTGTRVQKKYQINATNFSYGFVTPDDQWSNYWRKGPNQALGWDASLPGEGSGAKTMAQELAHSEQFAVCQVEKTFKNVCFREPVDAADRSQVSSMIISFKSSGYQLKQVFAEAAVYCMGD